ncbi:unnamed protein product [Kuraishia capsulata CBS 1993]|uniref:Uncharacterized protein n=1 Tax=Kuraishia capsulata CBS 1993 TaxID=1382522 RepID=W6MTY2_9ASCO|nr:uncharacterized protein KUCA_T00004726001 [Kuraishia capsulata CBS 1993]CDK28742.1 unnamed protein product [Kuraishia capsulata CBS 1993]
MFRLFWPLSSSSSSPALTIPTYLGGNQEDSIDLQIKSLIYMFNRYRVDKLTQFLTCVEPGYYKFEYVDSITNGEGNDKLDIIYNKSQFEEELLKDEYRILIDYVRNKFRAMLILSDFPKEIDQIPKFPCKTFNFVVLRADSTDQIYADVLINKSHIYSEYKTPYDVKLGILNKVLSGQRRSQKPGSTYFNKSDRSAIIKQYVQRLGFHIQVERIYKATLRSKEQINILKPLDENSEMISPFKSPKTSPRLKQQKSTLKLGDGLVTKPIPLFPSNGTKFVSPTKRRNSELAEEMHSALPPPPAAPTLKARASRMRLNEATSPPRTKVPSASPKRTLREKPSMSILKLDKLYAQSQTQRTQEKAHDSFLEYDSDDSSVLSGFEDASDFSNPPNEGSASSVTSGSGVSSGIFMAMTLEEKKGTYDNCKCAVRIRVEREKQLIRKKMNAAVQENR